MKIENEDGAAVALIGLVRVVHLQYGLNFPPTDKQVATWLRHCGDVSLDDLRAAIDGWKGSTAPAPWDAAKAARRIEWDRDQAARVKRLRADIDYEMERARAFRSWRERNGCRLPDEAELEAEMSRIRGSN